MEKKNLDKGSKGTSPLTARKAARKKKGEERGKRGYRRKCREGRIKARNTELTLPSYSKGNV